MMMIKTKEFSHDQIYDQTKDFFLSKGITKKSFRLTWNYIVTELNLHEHLTEEDATVFIADSLDDVGKAFSDYLSDTYFFDSKLIHLIEAYDDFFNHKKEDDCYLTQIFYLIDENGHLKRIQTFQFNELQYGDNHMLLIELADSDMLNFEDRLRDYYTQYFFNGDFPEEYKKPIAEITPEEREVIRMICI